MKFNNTPKDLIIPEELPLIAIKNAVLFPRVVIPLVIQRPSSVFSLQESLKKDRLVLFVSQKNLDDNVEEKDIYEVGTVGRIISVDSLMDGSSRIDVEGITRAEILKITQSSPFFKATIQSFSLKGQDDVESEALMRSVLDLYKRISENNRIIPSMLSNLLSMLSSQNDPEQIIDVISANLNIGVAEQQDVLETRDTKEALKKLNRILTRESEIIDAEKKVAKETKKQLGKMQKEAFLREQLKSIEKELGVEDDRGEIEIFRKKILKLKMPPAIEEKALKELDRLSKLPPFSPEVSYLRTYLDWLVEMPWNKKSKTDIDLKKASKILDEDHFGLEKTKERILEYMAVQKQVGKIKGPILCFTGPPGTGKTSIGRSIARALGREFVRVSLGGIRDEAEIRGHRRTYVGALPGRIIQGIHTAKTKDPVFMLDEIDKIGQDFRGDPSAALLETLDPEQNNSFSDHYLEVPFDLSDVLFIATANVLDSIPPALRDRLEVIDFSGYTEEEKKNIANRHLLPKILENHGFKPKDINFTSEALSDIINKHTHEAGVRNLERELSKIVRKITRETLDKKSKNIKIDEAKLHKYLGPRKYTHQLAENKDEIGVVTGLAWTPVGGEILSIEATQMPGKGKLILTGHLGTVMKESVQTAFSYVRTIAKREKAETDFYSQDIHIHVPMGAIPKDGPSAGVAMVTAITSLVMGRPVRWDVGMTGEITLRGKVLEIGGIKEKVLAARRAGLKIVIMPKENEKDLDEIPKEVKKDIEFIFAKHFDDVMKVAFRSKSKKTQKGRTQSSKKKG
ncbi:MAG: endopeptidase La [Candidatus Yanofskybacteria bacterium CG10_big_fil_rev_8_21_14_0_10_46_23]|uniref:Lon protease n=1 Tax=Candidatus Yanofskybacteria bacterium CG10_big_fil_rev_8_21_14_0_10_46_23 TaxID=1975098 RepID=A0A2H0R6G4_9BACT|nr:MAG: endopeptidase La [Candidatus Yanofskybacteria bacterium CG10_big_fil_rev_8_21_14_0_10_46_23]